MTAKTKKSAKSTPSVGRGTVDTKVKMRISSGSPVAMKGSAKPAGVATTVKFGSVTVEVRAPRKADVKRNIKAGQLSLARVRTKIVKPGVKIEFAKGIPLFHADPDCPGKLIRERDGKRERGVFLNGKFKRSR
jgi:hypothetical protein